MKGKCFPRQFLSILGMGNLKHPTTKERITYIKGTYLSTSTRQGTSHNLSYNFNFDMSVLR